MLSPLFGASEDLPGKLECAVELTSWPMYVPFVTRVPVTQSWTASTDFKTRGSNRMVRVSSDNKLKSDCDMTLTKLACLVLLIVCDGVAVHAQDLSAFFKGTKGAFVLYDMNNNRYVRYNRQRCRERFSPKSTFKIPNSLIGLETGVIRDAEFVIQWNRDKYPPQANWNQEPFVHWGKDQTLRSALKYSVVWYYRELALAVGRQQMKKYVKAFDYGNKDVSGRIDNFWLNNVLKISADEQVEFLKAFYSGRLGVSKRSTDIVKEILVFEQTPTYKLSAKTGGGPIDEGIYIGWFVGYLETQGNVYFFATNIEGPSFEEIRDKRIELTKQILKELGYLAK